ncbi:esterase [Leptolyngbya sp. O-77]|uniref:esterase n=1 Tax=Leptolyngbya sp. O-77 TaxID=1080068 RepID=UPI00074D494E|nr:esterase [Leptolyngbya sp. O-77]BAU40432.1 Alpha/beta hydrolase family protein [Leptolyngbya sp. O-77]
MQTAPTPTAAQIDQAREAIAAYVRQIESSPDRREGAYPYCLFHEPGQPIRGTVMMFHGFSAKPHQMWRLADYLFRNGLNVYQCTLAGHAFVNPDKNWCQVDLKPEIAIPLKEKVAADPVLQASLANLTNPKAAGDLPRPSYLQRMALIARLLRIEPRLLDILKAIERPNDPDFDRYFISSHLRYLTDARDRLRELDSLPGPIFTVGLSVGGAVALALAADQPDRIARVVAYAPLLEIYGEERRKYVELAGPLDIRELGWDPALRFPVGALTANARFGKAYVQQNVRSISRTPVFMVLTENEDAADIETNRKFYQNLGGDRQGHCFYQYPQEDLVPHPMIDPTEVSQGMSNRFWQSLYQETFRFLTTGEVNSSNLRSIDQDAALPAVPPI